MTHRLVITGVVLIAGTLVGFPLMVSLAMGIAVSFFIH